MSRPADQLGVVESLALLVPLEPGRVADVRAVLRALPAGEAGPFARTAGTRVGRLVVLEALEPPELLLSAFVEREPRMWLADFAAALGPRAAALIGAPAPGDAAAVAAWLLGHRVPSRLALAAHPGARVDEVEAALRLREALGRLAREAPALSVAQLRDRVREAVAG